jgi:hypothetical protein
MDMPADARPANKSMTRKVIRPVRVTPDAVGEVVGTAIDIAIDVAQNMLP